MFQQRLRELINLKCGGKQNEISKNTNISHSTISSYYTRGSMPSMEQLIQLADFFGCSIDYLVGRENEYGVVDSSNDASTTLTKEESEMLAMFKLLTLEDQHKAIGFVKALAY